MSYVKFQDRDWLLCPNCEAFLLHHGKVTIFEREKEDAPSSAIEVDGRKVDFQKQPKSDNPSGRRNGIVIHFWCENCPATPELTIAQHKGTTIVAWR